MTFHCWKQPYHLLVVCVLDYLHILYRAICGCICGYYNRFTYVNSIGYFHSKILQV